MTNSVQILDSTKYVIYRPIQSKTTEHFVPNQYRRKLQNAKFDNLTIYLQRKVPFQANIYFRFVSGKKMKLFCYKSKLTPVPIMNIKKNLYIQQTYGKAGYDLKWSKNLLKVTYFMMTMPCKEILETLLSYIFDIIL